MKINHLNYITIFTFYKKNKWWLDTITLLMIVVLLGLVSFEIYKDLYKSLFIVFFFIQLCFFKVEELTVVALMLTILCFIAYVGGAVELYVKLGEVLIGNLTISALKFIFTGYRIKKH